MMRRWVAVAVLATGMLAGACALEGGSAGAMACCAAMCQPAPAAWQCPCCRLSTASLPALAAPAPFTPAARATTVLRDGPGSLAAAAAEASALRSRLIPRSLSPPKVYVLKSSFLI